VLTADLAMVRRRHDAIELAPLDAKKRARAAQIGAQILAEIAAGKTRADLEVALSAIDTKPNEIKLKDGLIKIATDATTWTESDAEETEALRRDLFVRAAFARRSGAFDRAALIEEIARARSTTSEAIDEALFSDLRESNRVVAPPALDAPALVAEWDRSRAQAVLLRATRVRVAFRCDALRTRDLFRAIKFLGLIHTLEKKADGYILDVDGPFSLFESVTKYGLKLAMLLPVLESCDAYALEANVRWGKDRALCVFRFGGGAVHLLRRKPRKTT